MKRNDQQMTEMIPSAWDNIDDMAGEGKGVALLLATDNNKSFTNNKTTRQTWSPIPICLESLPVKVLF